MDLRKLCPPALLYLILSFIVLLINLLLNRASLVGFFIYSVIYVLFVALWTWILNLICNAGYKWISWVLVLLPLILFILIFFTDVVAILISMNKYKHRPTMSTTPTHKYI